MFHHAASPSYHYAAASPAPASDPGYAGEIPPPGPSPGLPLPLGVKASPTRLLVVDDTPDILYLVGTFLRHSGYEVETATSAFAAFGAARRRHFDAVISDIGMPAMSGYHLASALRSLPEYRDVLLVAITGFSEYDDAEAARRAGFNAHLKKPLDLSRLAEVLGGL